MPTVGGTKFNYNKKGQQLAKLWSEMTGKPVKQDKPRAKNLGAKKKPKRENRRTFLRVGEKRLPLEKAKIYTPKGREFDTSLIENMRESATPESTKYAQGGNILDIVKGLENVKQQKIDMAAMKAPGTQLQKRHGKKTTNEVMREMMAPENQEMLANLAMGSVGGRGAPSLKRTAVYLRKLLSKTKGSSQKNILRKQLSETEKKITKQEMQANRKAFDKETEGYTGRQQSRMKTERDPNWDLFTEDHLAQGGTIPQYGLGGWLKKGWNKHVKRGILNTGIQAGMGNEDARRRLLERAGGGGAWTNRSGYDPLGARQRFSGGSDISSLLKKLQGGNMEMGGEVPDGRRMYGMGNRKKSLQTADVGPVRGFKKGGKMPKGYHT